MKFYHGGREFFAKAFTQNFSHKDTKDTEILNPCFGREFCVYK